MPLAVNVARDNAELAAIDREQAGAVWPHEPCLFALHVAAHLHHILHGDVLCDTDHKIELRVHGLHDGVGCKAGRHVDDRCRCPRRCHGITHRIVDRYALNRFTGLARRHARDDLRAIFQHGLRMEAGRLARDALHDDFRILIR